MLVDWFTIVGVTVGALLPIANPFSAAPVFSAVTAGMPRQRRYQQGRQAAIYMACVLLVSLAAGVLILEFFGVSLPALRIAGGLVIARLGFSMLNPDPVSELSEEEEQEAMSMKDIAFTPIAMPLLSGPGSIAVTISIATEAEYFQEYFGVAIGIVIVAAISWLVLRFSSSIVDYMGATGITVMTRLMGLLLVGVGVQFVVNGAVELVTSDEIVQEFYQAFPEERPEPEMALESSTTILPKKEVPLEEGGE
jgi:multiple antibiotic resistance protein